MNTLHTAAARGDLETLRAYIAAGADINQYSQLREWHGETPLITAMRYHQADAMELLLAAGARADMSIVRQGLSRAGWPRGRASSADLLRILLARGLNPNTPGNSQKGYTLLMEMIGRDDTVELLNTLLDYGADIHARDHKQRTALMFAVYYCGDATIRLLCERGADINAQDKYGRHVLTQALYIHHDDWNLVTNRHAPIDFLEWEEDEEYFNEQRAKRMRLLLELGANPHLCDHRGYPALLHSLAMGNVPAAKLLLEHGATLNGVSPKRIRRAQRLMAHHHYTQSLRLLTQHIHPLGDTARTRPYFSPQSAYSKGNHLYLRPASPNGSSDGCLPPPKAAPLSISDTDLFTSGLYFLLEKHLLAFSPYNEDSELSPQAWQSIYAQAQKQGGGPLRALNEIKNWVEQHYQNGTRSIYLFTTP